ncbi:MAG: isochorismatase family protein [Planctomycetota bacterium]
MAASPLIDVSDSVLVLIDMQPSLVPLIIDHEAVIDAQRRLIAVARDLAVPILVTEQYPSGLGTTIPPLVEALGDAYRPLDKMSFSAWGDETFRHALAATNRHTPVLVGIESHICVCQTALEAAAAGYDVHVVPDAISARNEDGRRFGVERMQRYGIPFDTREMVIYQWLRRAGTPAFKQALKHVK